MSNMKKEFDVNQGHGDHIDCVTDGDVSQFAAEWLVLAAQEGEVMKSDAPVANRLGGEFPPTTPVFLIAKEHEPLRVMVIVAEKSPRDNSLISGYPEYDGAEVDVRITAIHEWANGLEATLEGEMLGGRRDVAFFDTRYPLHKGEYRIGETYTFRLAAFAYNNTHLMAEEEKVYRIEGQEAVDWIERTGKAIGREAEYDEDGNIKPIEFRMDGMVAYFCGPAAYPDDCEFQSPVFGDVQTVAAFGQEFCRMDIAIARDEDDSVPDITIPLIAKQSLFDRKPQPGDDIRGRLWLQGRLAAPAKV